MAEYVEVMEQKRRMCNSYALCSMGCPLNDTAFCGKNSGEKTNADFPEVERRVMSWAAEHLEPVYPTWEQVIAKMYLRSGRTKYHNITEWAINEHSPADIAQKLGIEPEEGA